MSNSVLLVDGMNLLIRHYIANPAMSSNGEYVGGVIGFLGMLSSIIRKNNPSKVIVVWESGGSPKKKSIYPEYKEGRKPAKMNRFFKDDDESLPDSEENKIWQVECTTFILNYLPIIQVYVPDCEADDVIGYLAKYRFKNENKIIVSSDKDFYQLINDQTIIYSPSKKLFIKEQDVLDEFNISPQNFAVAKAFCGDKSDNIDGVERVGFKILAKRFEQLKEKKDVSINEILTEAEEKSKEKKAPKIFENIYKSSDIVKRNFRIMHLDTAMLNDNQIDQINETLDTFKLQYRKLKVHEIRRDLGLPQLDVERICNSVAYLIY